jgi:hypothetical protein
MVRVAASADSDTVGIAGRGISLLADFPLAPGLTLRPNPPKHELQAVADGCESFGEYAAILSMMPQASFYLEVRYPPGGENLAIEAWNSLWLFHFLAVACQTPCESLYSWSGHKKVVFSVATAHPTLWESSPVVVSDSQLAWAKQYRANFDQLLGKETFTKALRSYCNSHHLFGFESRVMLLWSGIECLFEASTELTRTLSLYSALMLERSNPDTRYELYKRIRREYDRRSKVVHGSKDKRFPVEGAYKSASEILIKLLARCVELCRVPTAEELDRAALVGFIDK